MHAKSIFLDVKGGAGCSGKTRRAGVHGESLCGCWTGPSLASGKLGGGPGGAAGAPRSG